MFNFSANHLFLLSRTEYRSCTVLLMRDDDTQRVYRLHDFSKGCFPRPGVAYCVAGKVNSADRLFLVVESIREDTINAVRHPFNPGARERTSDVCTLIVGEKAAVRQKW